MARLRARRRSIGLVWRRAIDLVGELSIPGVAAAIYHATDIRVRDLPITPDTLIQA